MFTPRLFFPVWLPRVLALLLCLHFGRGLLPFTPVEGDDLGVANGVQAWIRGTGDFNAASYAYPIQPGSYHVIDGVSRLTGWPPLSVFCALSALAAIGFIFLSGALLARATGLRLTWVVVALLLTPELISAACYANTSALAGVVVMGGLIVAQRARGRTGFWLAGLLLGLGGWLRMDSLLLSPVVLPLRFARNPSRRAVWETAEIAFVSGLALLAACASSGSPLSAAWQEFSHRDNVHSLRPFSVNGWLVLGFVATLTSLAGLARFAGRRCWWLLGFVAAGSVPCLLVYAGNFTTPKYLYYAAPFLLLPALVGLRALLADGARWRSNGFRLALAIVALFAAETVLGVQSSSPAFRRFDPAPPWVRLASLRVGGKNLQLGLGEGEIIPTDDGPRLRGGQFWAPQMWHREKTALRTEMTRLDARLATQPPDLIITSTYLSYRVADGWLRDHAYRCDPPRQLGNNPTSFAVNCQGPTGQLRLIQINHTEADAREFSASTSLARRILFLNDRGAVAFRHLTPEARDWRLLSPSENQLLTVYEYQPQ